MLRVFGLKITPVCSATLVVRWERFAKLRNPGFRFDGTVYPRPSRAAAGDSEGLREHIGPLLELIKLAPFGCPSQELQFKHGVLEVLWRHQFKASSDQRASGASWCATRTTLARLEFERERCGA